MSLSPEAMRRVGMSDLGALLGIDTMAEPASIWTRVVHGIEIARDPELDRMGRVGTLTERSTAEMAAEALWPSQQVRLLKPETRLLAAPNEHLRYSLDFISGLADDPVDGGFQRALGPVALIECKLRDWHAFRQQGWGREGTDEIPAKYIAQTQGQLEAVWRDRDYWAGTEVPDLDAVEVAVRVGAFELKLYRVRRDRELGCHLLDEVVGRFWRDHVQAGIAPPLLGTPVSRAILLDRYPRVEEPIREATMEEIALGAMLHAAAREAKEAERRVERIKARLCEIIGSSEGIRGPLPEGGSFVARWSDRAGQVSHKAVAAELARRLHLSDEELEQLQDQHRGQPSREFKPAFTE